MDGLMLHCGAAETTRDDVFAVPTPAPTDTHYPIPHGQLIDTVGNVLADTGFNVVSEQHGLAQEGHQYFGTLALESTYDDRQTVIGLRNSHNKTFPAAMAVGTSVFVCDNLSFSGDVRITRKHTRFIARDLAAMIVRGIGKLGDAMKFQDRRIAAYKEAELTDMRANDLLVRSLEAKAIVPQQLVKVLQEWRHPSHEEFAPRTMWSLFNSFTEIYKAQPTDTTRRRSLQLHGLFDAALGLGA